MLKFQGVCLTFFYICLTIYTSRTYKTEIFREIFYLMKYITIKTSVSHKDFSALPFTILPFSTRMIVTDSGRTDLEFENIRSI